MIIIAAQAAATAPAWLVTVAVPILTAIAGAVLGKLFEAWSAATTRRRDGYSDAAEALVAWSEYPYRVRRRTSDDPEVLAALAAHGHELQESIARAQMWVASENRAVSDIFDHALTQVRVACGPLTAEAWQEPPITKAAGMNLNGWGCGTAAVDNIRRFQDAATWRFGPRRLVSAPCALLVAGPRPAALKVPPATPPPAHP